MWTQNRMSWESWILSWEVSFKWREQGFYKVETGYFSIFFVRRVCKNILLWNISNDSKIITRNFLQLFQQKFVKNIRLLKYPVLKISCFYWSVFDSKSWNCEFVRVKSLASRIWFTNIYFLKIINNRGGNQLENQRMERHIETINWEFETGFFWLVLTKVLWYLSIIYKNTSLDAWLWAGGMGQTPGPEPKGITKL